MFFCERIAHASIGAAVILAPPPVAERSAAGYYVVPAINPTASRISNAPGGNQRTKLSATLAPLEKLNVGWDGDGAPPPNPRALYWARTVIEQACVDGLESLRVRAMGDGGVAVLFAKGRATVAIECFNSGSVVIAKSSGPGTTTAEEYEPNEDVVSDMIDDARGFLS